MNDQQEFLEICTRERDNVYRYIFLRTGYHRETSEDLTQDIFLKLWQSWSSYDESKATMRTWIFRIAHNTLIDFYRKQGRVESVELDTALVAIEIDELNPA
ncbi:RNA polymerase sigma factor, partial [Candidatus Dojkabacteria bacterium]|nr:RNA polymerase sigma factor [Candidatus Dojkabacteria bacterium]